MDEVIYIVGSGTSLRGFDFNRLRGKRCIAINREFETVPWAEVCYFSDPRVYGWYHSGLSAFAGRKVTIAKCSKIGPEVEVYVNTGRNGIDFRPRCLRTGNNSAHAAANLAIHLGAKVIVLLGIDMQPGKDGLIHHHKGHPHPTRPDVYEKMLPYWYSVEEALRGKSIQIYNASPNSALKCFPEVTLDWAMELETCESA